MAQKGRYESRRKYTKCESNLIRNFFIIIIFKEKERKCYVFYFDVFCFVLFFPVVSVPTLKAPVCTVKISTPAFEVLHIGRIIIL